jgi:hypothetical protein
MGVAVNTSQPLFAPDGRDKQLSEQLQLVGRQVVSFASARQSFIDSITCGEQVILSEGRSN